MSDITVVTEEIAVQTAGGVDLHDVTAEVSKIVRGAGLRDGVVVVHVPGSTGGMTTIEYESGLLEDLKKALERLAPEDASYAHNARWGDGNGHSHVRASLIGPSISIPVHGGKPLIGTWQQIVFVELDNRPRSRRLVVQLVGTR